MGSKAMAFHAKAFAIVALLHSLAATSEPPCQYDESSCPRGTAGSTHQEVEDETSLLQLRRSVTHGFDRSRQALDRSEEAGDRDSRDVSEAGKHQMARLTAGALEGSEDEVSGYDDDEKSKDRSVYAAHEPKEQEAKEA